MPDLLTHLKQRCTALAAALGCPVPLRTSPAHNGCAHIEEDGRMLSYVVTEQGRECERRVTADEDELLYWVASDAVFASACSYERQHRMPGQDSRRRRFDRELELLDRLSPAWSARKRAEIGALLKEHP